MDANVVPPKPQSEAELRERSEHAEGGGGSGREASRGGLRPPIFKLLLMSGLAACSSRQAALPAPGASSGASAARPEEACVPTGPERCFDARDDNCNGLIDEGCGMPSGLVQFVIAWDALTADVDLLVSDPRGELAEVGRRTAAGLVKDRDCPGRKQDCAGKNYENVYLDREEAKRGAYRVRVRLERLEDEDVPIRVTLGARIGPKTYSAELSLVRAEDTRELVFVL